MKKNTGEEGKGEAIGEMGGDGRREGERQMERAKSRREVHRGCSLRWGSRWNHTAFSVDTCHTAWCTDSPAPPPVSAAPSVAPPAPAVPSLHRLQHTKSRMEENSYKHRQ